MGLTEDAGLRSEFDRLVARARAHLARSRALTLGVERREDVRATDDANEAAVVQHG